MPETQTISSKKSPNAVKKQKHIIESALNVFSVYGLQGASMEQIAEEAGISKSNLFYYFQGKDDLYIAVLSYVLTEWLLPLNRLSTDQNPQQALGDYIEIKYRLAKKMPQASRLYALEMMQGAPYVSHILKTSLKQLVQQKTDIIQTWIEQGKLKPVSPLHLIIHIWAVTQHYSDFSIQTQAISGKSLNNKSFYHDALATTKQLLLESLIPFGTTEMIEKKDSL
ncbi:TetR family transcriptional regulator C-terminal domain-containing protein [Acinetobacter sp.]|uniref:TetR family transcriptional regulator C-terminal domain-containing protein n=1 Tax=Acinetobacter sp. TaxID=472 RepID=UPI0031DFAB53